MPSDWRVAPADPEAARRLARHLGASPLLAQCLLNRGLRAADEAGRFLAPRLAHLGDPLDLPDMDRAVSRLTRARQLAEPVVIFGDYDVDGVTATAILRTVLADLGWEVHTYLPHRLAEGYGLARESVEKCLALHPARVLLAVDCGSTAVATIADLQQRGVDVVVLDHHQPADPPPPATALVNPLRIPALDHPARSLCSAGLAFKLAHALVKSGRASQRPAELAYDIRPLLDLAALGTVADLVPLLGDNRILVATGLRRLAEDVRPGLAALLECAQVSRNPGVYEVGFQLAPRLNAAGRLETATDALDLLLCADWGTARPLAERLDHQNRERQRIEREIADQAVECVKTRLRPADDFVVVEASPRWHIGVVGIVASRILREFNRPTLILGGDGDHLRGSGRSLEGFDLAAALRECGDLLLRHGGHALAAGLSVLPEHVDALRARLNSLAASAFRGVVPRPVVRVDAEVSLAELSLPGVEELGRLEPAGQGNPNVQVVVPNVTLADTPRRIGRDRRHVKFGVQQDGVRAEAVWWGAGDVPVPQGRFDLAVRPGINDYEGRRSVQLKVLDWRPAGPRS